MEPGDYVLLRQRTTEGREGTTSKRFLSKNDAKIYQIASKPNEHQATLCDPATGSTDFGFVQPVHVSRVVPVDLLTFLTARARSHAARN